MKRKNLFSGNHGRSYGFCICTYNLGNDGRSGTKCEGHE